MEVTAVTEADGPRKGPPCFLTEGCMSMIKLGLACDLCLLCLVV